MKTQTIITLAISCLLLTDCVAISKRKSWMWRKSNPDTTSTPYVSFIEINLLKEVIWVPTPIIATEVNSSPDYLLDIDFHTETKNEYHKLDSIRYKIIASDNRTINEGVLPIKNGELSIRSYSPGIYRAQCTTKPSIRLGKQKQALNGTFTIYATGSNGQPKSIYINNIILNYYKPKIISFF
ncbi:hypothetical protein [Hymenobacter guriensis]|uniref:Gliding motility lipoprotein GldH n=1 Tax=Hymenobacter guriensis TaxID=2793065 RepID=A0ABS0KYG5_9BACT|nr:hypothetical protein [Hymenobacter guriensis]MBG8552239.1 hypothetical protein [Hymenobacter guriensis]